jgi:hypothetical protein
MRRDERLRVSAAKILVASLPSTLEAINRLLKVRTGIDAYEVHFSLFLFLADVDTLKLKPTATQRVVELIVSYLQSARVGTASAAWMAGHALGAHLCDAHVAQLLVQLARNGKWAVGRSEAVRSLGEWMDETRTPVSPEFTALLRDVSRRDPSDRVRANARVALRKGATRRSAS